MTNEEVQPTQNPKILGAVELKKIELKPFDGQKSKIAEIIYEDHATFGMYAKVKTMILEGSPEKSPVYATKILGLVEVKNEETQEIEGYGWGKESNTAMFLKKQDFENLIELIGTEVIVRYEIKKNKEILTF